MLERDSRRELADFLRTRRARLSPGEFGFSSGKRRRVLGLRREEVAAVAGVGLTWNTWLEQGKDIQVSAAFLENLTRALKLTAAERSHLFALAQHRLPPLSRPAVRSHSTEHLQSILDVIGTPAYVRNSRFDVIAWNTANTRMFGDFSSIPPEERNVIWLMFARSYHRRTMPDWDADARSLLAKFRLNLGQAAEPGEFLGLISELNAISADFRQIWAEHEVSDLGEGVTRFRSPREGEILFQHQTIMPEAHPELRIVVFIASNTGATAAKPLRGSARKKS